VLTCQKLDRSAFGDIIDSMLKNNKQSGDKNGNLE
jgi:hypothetical protein